EDRLHARQHHPALVEQHLRRLRELEAFALVAHGVAPRSLATGRGRAAHSDAYAASSFGASYFHSSSFSTRRRPKAPISARSCASSMSSTIFAARLRGSLRRA